ncbi:uncharacterized protein F5Z01DRAFT_111621 [Emericellopsis atlantica]|uniref:FAD-binding domain-containing protein n=1 Tax=Emericellopsis atlantica TaxID=2614577 RepID=A0A9P8CQS1_9HYPO|nr:uncharacterized protein F5Z01DRAFT_111621 [Emericellopsis atlantica]KAG9254011.1 hypothetical protein F5Z01DRAFT_111621 [Emericellopsis atlantica]
MSLSAKPVLISGAGLASLLFAQSLRQSNIPFRIFERDASFVFRAQGYRLRLSDEGLDAIESVLDPPTWTKFWDACGQTAGAGFAAWDAVTGEQTDHKMPEKLASRGGKVVGIARGDMRKVFADGCQDKIEWSKHVTGYELTEDGVRALFADGTKSDEGCMLVGGEGIYSKVARQLSGGKLKVFDTGARGIHGQAPATAFQGLGEGVHRLLDTSRGPGKDVSIITNVRPGELDDPTVRFGWTMATQPGALVAPNNDFSQIGKPAADMAKELTRHWAARFKPLFDQMQVEDAAFWKITCSSPSGVPVWQNEPRVTVIGDAAHSMTPAGGIGANTAVQDSALLGRLLREAGGFRPGVTEAYEKEMRVYASEAVNASYTLAKGAFGIEIDEESTPTV